MTATYTFDVFSSLDGYGSQSGGNWGGYYAGAFGAAVFHDSVSSTDAIVFLAGTNVGAAGYEYGLARLTRFVLRSRSPAGVRVRRHRSGAAEAPRRASRPGGAR